MSYLTRQIRRSFALGAVLVLGDVAATAVEKSSMHLCPVEKAPATVLNSPSKLDYLLIASLVDSPHLLSMAAYRSTPPKPAVAVPQP